MGFAPFAGWAMVADTGASGFALQNGTPTILTWTAPNDGVLHVAFLVVNLRVTSAETGGMVQWQLNTSPSSLQQVFASGFGIGMWGVAPTPFAVPPGETVALNQTAALTAGAATIYAQIWAA